MRISVLLLLLLSTGQLAMGQSLIRGPYLQMPSSSEMTIRWKTDTNLPTAVWAGTSLNQLSLVYNNINPTQSHVARISGLNSNQKYYYAIGHEQGSTPTYLSGPSGDLFFRTSPPVGERGNYRIMMQGDSGGKGWILQNPNNSNYQKWSADTSRVFDSMKAFSGERQADVWLMLGDNAYVGGTEAEHQESIFDPDAFASLLKTVPVELSFGNHEIINSNPIQKSGPFFDLFSFPTGGERGGVPSGDETYYSFDHGNIHFISLNTAIYTYMRQSVVSSYAQQMESWLQSDLAANQSEWTIVFFHHPPYSKRDHDSDSETDLTLVRERLVPILDQAGVDLVLAAHSHIYQRSRMIRGHHGPGSSSSQFSLQNHTLSLNHQGDGEMQGTGAYRKKSGPRSGTVYSVLGSSSYMKFSTPGAVHPVMVSTRNSLGSMVLDVNGLQLDGRFINEKGQILDHFTIVKDGVTPVTIDHAAIPKLDTDWRVYDSGSQDGLGWFGMNYDDSSWMNGRAPIGFNYQSLGFPVIATPVTNLSEVTYYYRKLFDGSDLDSAYSMRLNVFHTDGFLARINGNEAKRVKLPSGPIQSSDLAQPEDTLGFQVFDLSNFQPGFNAGSNILAFETHQASTNEQDLVFDASLEYDAFIPFLKNSCKGVEDVLRVNGSNGGLGRSVDVPVGEPLTISVQLPESNQGGRFILLARIDDPRSDESRQMGPYGEACFNLRNISNPSIFVLADSQNPQNGLIPGVRTAPWSMSQNLPSTTVGFILVIQGLIHDSNGYRMTNPVRFKIVP